MKVTEALNDLATALRMAAVKGLKDCRDKDLIFIDDEGLCYTLDKVEWDEDEHAFVLYGEAQTVEDADEPEDPTAWLDNEEKEHGDELGRSETLSEGGMPATGPGGIISKTS